MVNTMSPVLGLYSAYVGWKYLSAGAAPILTVIEVDVDAVTGIDLIAYGSIPARGYCLGD